MRPALLQLATPSIRASVFLPALPKLSSSSELPLPLIHHATSSPDSNTLDTTTMRPAVRLLAAQRTPLIKFIGKRSIPTQIDHTPHVHPASPSPSLPDSFAESFVEYRSKAQQHGPLKNGQQQSNSYSTSSQSQTRMSAGIGGQGGSQTYGPVGGVSGKSLGSITPPKGEYFDRSDLPKRFQRMVWTEAEIEAVDSAGASMWN